MGLLGLMIGLCVIWFLIQCIPWDRYRNLFESIIQVVIAFFTTVLPIGFVLLITGYANYEYFTR